MLIQLDSNPSLLIPNLAPFSLKHPARTQREAMEDESKVCCNSANLKPEVFTWNFIGKYPRENEVHAGHELGTLTCRQEIPQGTFSSCL